MMSKSVYGNDLKINEKKRELENNRAKTVLSDGESYRTALSVLLM